MSSPKFAFGFLAMAFTSFSFPAVAGDYRLPDNVDPSVILRNDIQPLIKNLEGSKEDVGTFLQKQKVFKPADEVEIADDLEKLPAPPDPDLLAAMQCGAFAIPYQQMEWIPSKKIGALLSIQGSGDCQTWVMFAVSGKEAVPIAVPDIFGPNPPPCAKEGRDFDGDWVGASTYIGQIGPHVVAILAENDTTASGTVELLSLQVWNGSRWSTTAQTDVTTRP